AALVDKTVRSGAAASHDERRTALDVVLAGVLWERRKLGNHQWPIRRRPRLRVQAVVAHVAYHAHHFAPGAAGIRADLLAYRAGRLTPQLARQRLRDHCHSLESVGFSPREI